MSLPSDKELELRGYYREHYELTRQYEKMFYIGERIKLLEKKIRRLEDERTKNILGNKGT